jgi:hypothetical protein
MALSQARTKGLTELQPADDRGHPQGCPFSFCRGPTFRFVPTLVGKWGQKKSININRVPTGPTWATNFCSFPIGMMGPR